MEQILKTVNEFANWLYATETNEAFKVAFFLSVFFAVLIFLLVIPPKVALFTIIAGLLAIPVTGFIIWKRGRK